MKNKGKEILRPTLTLFAICLIVTVLLAFTNAATEKPIAQAAERSQQESMQQVLPDCDEYRATEAQGISFWTGMSGSEAVGYVFVTSSRGYGGDISVMTGVDSKGAITGVQLLDCSETPGLGQKAKEEAFRSQYTGKSGELNVVKNGSGGEKEINAITGATITSRAVTDAVNEALQQYETVKGGVSGGEE